MNRRSNPRTTHFEVVLKRLCSAHSTTNRCTTVGMPEVDASVTLRADPPSCKEKSRERPLRKAPLCMRGPISGGSLPPRQPFAAAGPVVPPRSLNHCHTKTLHGFGCFAKGETAPRSRTRSVSEGQFPRNRWSPVFRSCLGPQSVSLREQSQCSRGMPVRLLAAVRNTLVVSHRLPNGNPITTPRKEPRPEIIYVD